MMAFARFFASVKGASDQKGLLALCDDLRDNQLVQCSPIHLSPASQAGLFRKIRWRIPEILLYSGDTAVHSSISGIKRGGGIH